MALKPRAIPKRFVSWLYAAKCCNYLLLLDSLDNYDAYITIQVRVFRQRLGSAAPERRADDVDR